ncbi:MAG: tRNA epoxyqueuosine(34) reductase QueG [Rhodothermia bacterium]|nr:MAG: tRNA epoxyqueuosine(34) reductase QueG [Rhodothermia bacterium]
MSDPPQSNPPQSNPPLSNPLNLKTALREQALRLGFIDMGISRAEPLDRESKRLREWLKSGNHGTMGWMERNFEKRTDPRELVPGAISVISVLENYFKPIPHSTQPKTGRISRYAWGDDYHLVMREKLQALLSWLQEQSGAEGRVFVDSAPVMDKAWAARSGLGWIGKHSNLISATHGSWFFIGELIVDIELEPDERAADMCGTCTRCLDACPTDAITRPYVVDSKRCISYLTIEHREDDISSDLQARLGNWIYGCDICQDVCPWNRFSQPASETRYDPRPGTLDTRLADWADMEEADFRKRFSKSPVKRTKWNGFIRNVRMARQNAGEPDSSETTSSRSAGESET